MISLARLGPAIVLVAFALLAPCAGADARLRAYDESLADRTILVTFENPAQRRPRVLAGAGAGEYARRGDYAASTWSRREARRIGERYALEQLEAWPVRRLGVECVVYLVPEHADVAAVLARLRSDPRIALAQPMAYFRTDGEGYSDPYYPLQLSVQALDLARLHRETSGRGVRVAIIDTGVDCAHVDLAGRLDYRQNLVSAVSPEFCADRHGTAVAGIIGARAANAAGIVGLAPGASLIVLKACWPTSAGGEAARCNSLTIARAIDVALARGARVLNLSLHGPHDALLAALIGAAIASGVIVVAADAAQAGEAHDFPASLPDVLAVGGDADPAPRRAHVEQGMLRAPARNVLSTAPGNAYAFVSGASYAAAHVTGLVALMLEREPSLAPAQLVAHIGAASILHSDFAGGEHEHIDTDTRSPDVLP